MLLPAMKNCILPVMKNCIGLAVHGTTIYMLTGGAYINKLSLFLQYWNQADHHRFPCQTRRAIETVMVASRSKSNPNIFSKMPRDLIPLILSFIPY
jgi:hypothetical protein